MPPPASEAQHECPICFQRFPSDAISIHCDTHFSLAAEHVTSEDDDVVFIEAQRQHPASSTHNRRSACIPQRAQAQPPPRAVAREPQDVQSQNLSPLLCASLAAQATGQAHVTGDAYILCVHICSCTQPSLQERTCSATIYKLSLHAHIHHHHSVQAAVAISTPQEVILGGVVAGETCR